MVPHSKMVIISHLCSSDFAVLLSKSIAQLKRYCCCKLKHQSLKINLHILKIHYITPTRTTSPRKSPPGQFPTRAISPLTILTRPKLNPQVPILVMTELSQGGGGGCEGDLSWIVWGWLENCPTVSFPRQAVVHHVHNSFNISLLASFHVTSTFELWHQWLDWHSSHTRSPIYLG